MSSLSPLASKLKVRWWELRTRRANRPPPLHHVTQLSARIFLRLITWVITRRMRVAHDWCNELRGFHLTVS